MRNYKILNRPMFNPNVSAYGRGIASNLVSEEQRQRFNYGGRVGLAVGTGGYTGEYGTPWEETYRAGLPISPERTAYDKLSYADKADYMWGDDKIISVGPGQSIDIRETDEGLEVGPDVGTSIAKKMPDSKTTDEVFDWPLYLKGDDPTATKADQIVKGKSDPDSDQLFTDEEQKEKKSQMMLAMAERLVGGSRDKWGSKAQMENISGAIGDIRKIADPSERREMQAKYKAYWEGAKERDLATAKYESELAAKPKTAEEYRQAGVTPEATLWSMAGITASPTIEKQKSKGKLQKQYDKLRPGDVAYDKNQDTWVVKTPTGMVTATIEEVISYHKTGKLTEMRSGETPSKE